MSNFHPVEVVGLGSETQLQVGENFNHITYEVKGLFDETVQFTLMRQKRWALKTTHDQLLKMFVCV